MKFVISKTADLPKDEFGEALKRLKPGESFIPLDCAAKPWGKWDFAKMQIVTALIGWTIGKKLRAVRHEGGVRIDCL